MSVSEVNTMVLDRKNILPRRRSTAAGCFSDRCSKGGGTEVINTIVLNRKNLLPQQHCTDRSSSATRYITFYNHRGYYFLLLLLSPAAFCHGENFFLCSCWLFRVENHRVDFVLTGVDFFVLKKPPCWLRVDFFSTCWLVNTIKHGIEITVE